jgi:plasmid stability protein
MKQITIDLPDDLHARLKEEAQMSRRSMKQEVVSILQQFLTNTREVDVTIDELRALQELRAERKQRAE